MALAPRKTNAGLFGLRVRRRQPDVSVDVRLESLTYGITSGWKA